MDELYWLRLLGLAPAPGERFLTRHELPPERPLAAVHGAGRVAGGLRVTTIVRPMLRCRLLATRAASLAASLAVSIGLSLGLGACSGSGGGSASATSAFGANVTRPAPTPTTAPDTAGLGRFVPAVGGLTPSTAPTADNGPFNLDTAVVKYAQKDAQARQLLTAGGFVGGYATTFDGPGSSTTAVQLYQLKDTASAQEFATYLREHAMQGVEAFNVQVNGVPGALGFVQSKGGGAGTGTIGGVLFVKGPYLAYIGSSSPGTDVTGFLQSTAQAQYAALPG
jgi:hypothetical protein